MAGQVRVDASFVLAMLLRENYTLQARTRWQEWSDAETEVVSAPLFFAEVTSVLRESVYFRRIPPAEGDRAFAEFLGLSVTSLACELWTADRRLANAVRAPWLKWVGDITS